MWRAADIRIEIVGDATDHPIVTATIETPQGTILVMGAAAAIGRALVLTKLHIHGEDVRRNMFGYRRLRWLAQAVMEVMDVDELRIEGEVRTTGAGPGHRPRPLRFARAVRPPD
jgi:citrate lyase beta subunit